MHVTLQARQALHVTAGRTDIAGHTAGKTGIASHCRQAPQAGAADRHCRRALQAGTAGITDRHILLTQIFPYDTIEMFVNVAKFCVN